MRLREAQPGALCRREKRLLMGGMDERGELQTRLSGAALWQCEEVGSVAGGGRRTG